MPKNKTHVIYVWLDALTNYLSALNYPDTSSNLYQSYWPADLHIIGKDILNYRDKKFNKNEFFFDYQKKEVKPKRKMGHFTTLIK